MHEISAVLDDVVACQTDNQLVLKVTKERGNMHTYDTSRVFGKTCVERLRGGAEPNETTALNGIRDSLRRKW
jgi:hypothetical protein